MRTDTTQYEAAHGRRPRGRGRWGFRVTVHRGLGTTTEDVFMDGPMAEARDLAVQQVRSMVAGQVVRVEVLP